MREIMQVPVLLLISNSGPIMGLLECVCAFRILIHLPSIEQNEQEWDFDIVA